jgi:2-methylcitrate dehydratase PrpD
MGNALDATLALLQGHEIKLEDVAEVVVEGGPRILRMFQQYLPSEKIAVIEDAHHFAAVVHQGQVRTQDRKYHPQNPIQCQFSMPWSVASAIVHGKVGIDDFTWQALQDKRVLDFAQRVTYKLNPELARAMVVEPVVVEIKMKSGEVYTKRVEASLGSPENPASWDIIINKFRDCCAHAVKPIPRENVDRVVRMAETLEDVTDVTEIVHLLA